MKIGLRVKKILAIALLVGIMIPSVAMASSYNLTYSFKYHLIGPERYFDGQNIKAYLNSNAELTHATSDVFQVTLYRSVVGIDNRIGSGYAWRKGASTINWSNVGSGTYYLDFLKADDGIYVTNADDTSKMSNY
ncbi:MAG TPA: hypothetical protein DDY49_05145 [Paenibacillaceae bacterium]|nr:hypothetical protein [Paenibacillaceae bacterium]